jgi:hypothetical protein
MLVSITALLVTILLAGCDSSTDRCGDGLVTSEERCDGADLNGATCADVLPDSSGELGCTEACEYDLTDCSVCGDGVLGKGEECDCGSTVALLPDGCNDVNGASGSSCGTDCTKRPVCGNGVQETGELCDCGTDPDNLPPGCSDVNGAQYGNCSIDCRDIGPVCGAYEPWRACNPLDIHACCPDEWGAELQCVEVDEDYYCLRSCSTDADCYWSNACHAPSTTCLPVECGGDTANGGLMLPCQLPDGGSGICYPHGSRMNEFGLPEPDIRPRGRCMETSDGSALAPGSSCDVPDDRWSVDRSEPRCSKGICVPEPTITEGRCMQLCSWEEHYDSVFYSSTAPWLPCPQGHPCIGLETFEPSSGLTTGDYGLCWDDQSQALPAIIPCSRISGLLLANPSQSCSDIGIPHMECAGLEVEEQGQLRTTISLIGACKQDTSGAQRLEVWEACDPTVASPKCPPRTVCEKEEPSGAPNVPTRCVPYCDTQHPDAALSHCLALGALPTSNATPVCRSLSLLQEPFGPDDVRQSRLGLCLF